MPAWHEAKPQARGSKLLKLRIYRNTCRATCEIFTGDFKKPVNIRFEKQQSFFTHE
jgi:hypothetical protein